MTEPYRLRVTASAGRIIQDKLPETVAAAVIEFITGTLLDNPHRVGKALHNELKGVHSARRGVRILYEIDDNIRLVTVLSRRLPHRRLPPSLRYRTSPPFPLCSVTFSSIAKIRHDMPPCLRLELSLREGDDGE